MAHRVTVLGPPDPDRDLLMHAALDPPDAAHAAWTQWRAQGNESKPIAFRWLPLVAWNLRNVDLDHHSRQRLAAARQRAWAANLRLYGCSLPALQAMVEQDIPVIVLKGAALAHTVYETPALRLIGDIDILVRPHDAAAARAILDRLGWRPSRHVADRDLLLCHGVGLHRGHGAVDLHWYLLPECCWPSADRALWTRTADARLSGIRTQVLSAADQLLHTCVHGLRWSPVHGGYWVADVARVVQSANGGVDWDVLINESLRRDLAFQVHDALSFVATHGWADVPPDVLATLRRSRVSWAARLECRATRRPVVSLAGLFVIWRGWRRAVRGAAGDRAPRPSWLRFLAAAVGQPSRRALLPWFGRHLAARARFAFRGVLTRASRARQLHSVWSAES
jgi:hypothetical protein